MSTDSSGAPQWNTSALIASLNAMHNPSADEWIMDSGASSQMASDAGISYPPSPTLSVTVGNGSSLPVTHVGSSRLSTPSSNFSLNNIILVTSIVKNLISVRHFTFGGI